MGQSSTASAVSCPDGTTARKLPRSRGWFRRGSPKTGFYYVNAQGERIRSPAHLRRIEKLRIPPAWRDVCISPSHHSNLQATGYDAKGRKQYLYHPEFTSRQAQRKFERLRRFAQALPYLRTVTSEHLHLEGLPKEKVLAAVTRLINETYFRVGCERYARRHRTFGASSLRKRHCQIHGREIVIGFRGNRSIVHRRVITDQLLLDIILELKQLPGTRLFQYCGDDGKIHPVHSRTLNQYLKELIGADCSAKDFRTFGASLLAAEFLAENQAPRSETDAKRRISACVRRVAEQLGNTPAITRSAYIHPKIFELYRQGKTLKDMPAKKRRRRQVCSIQADYTPEEIAFLDLLDIARNGPYDGDCRQAESSSRSKWAHSSAGRGWAK